MRQEQRDEILELAREGLEAADRLKATKRPIEAPVLLMLMLALALSQPNWLPLGISLGLFTLAVLIRLKWP